MAWTQIFLLILLPCIANASDFQSPRTAALGGAGHAGPMLNDALYLNPANTSYLPAYSISGNFSLYRGQPVPSPYDDQGGNLWNVSIQDGKSELFQAGLGFTWRKDAKIIHAGASRSLIKQLGVGVGAKFFFGKDHQSAQDFTASVIGFPFDWFQASLIIDNLLQSQSSQLFGLYREVQLGTKFNVMGIFMLYFDPLWVPSHPAGEVWGTEAGIEFTLMSDLFLRMGYFRNANIPSMAVRGQGFGTGLGWLTPRFSIDYGFQRVLTFMGLEHEPTSTHSFGLSFFF